MSALYFDIAEEVIHTKDFIHSLKFKILVGILALLFGIMLYTATADSAVSSFLGLVFSPVQKLSSSISNKVSTSLDMLTNASKYYKENKELRKQLDELYIQMVDYSTIKDENEQYEKILGLKEEFPDYKFSPPCRVIGRTTNDIYQSFFIDKGSKDGVSLHDPVVTDAGFVGIISDVQMTYSKVTTVLSPEFPMGVYCIRTKETAVLEGTYDIANDGLCQIKFINRDSDITAGDIIVTSGHSGLVPKGRVVGTIEDVSIDKSGLSLNATVKPIVDITDVKNVFVITEFEGQGVEFNE